VVKIVIDDEGEKALSPEAEELLRREGPIPKSGRYAGARCGA